MKQFFYTVLFISVMVSTTNTFAALPDLNEREGFRYFNKKYQGLVLSENDWKTLLVDVVKNNDSSLREIFESVSGRDLVMKKEDYIKTLLMIDGRFSMDQIKEKGKHVDGQLRELLYDIISRLKLIKVTASTFYRDHQSLLIKKDDAIVQWSVPSKEDRPGDVDAILCIPTTEGQIWCGFSSFCGNPVWYPDTKFIINREESSSTTKPSTNSISGGYSSNSLPQELVGRNRNGATVINITQSQEQHQSTVNANTNINTNTNTNTTVYREVGAPAPVYGSAPVQYASAPASYGGGYSKVVTAYDPNVLDYINTGVGVYNAFFRPQQQQYYQQQPIRGGVYNNTQPQNYGSYTGNHQASTAFAPGTTVGIPSNQTGTGNNGYPYSNKPH